MYLMFPPLLTRVGTLFHTQHKDLLNDKYEGSSTFCISLLYEKNCSLNCSFEFLLGANCEDYLLSLFLYYFSVQHS